MKQDAHFIHTNLERDFQVDGWHDIKMVTKGDACPVCSNPLDETRGIEMGQVFKLGQKYSKSLGANFTDESGQQLPFHMGCYGWGISRSIAGVVEQLHDENGILWPISLAPYHIIITLINPKNEEQSEAAETIYNLLKEKGEEVLLDDRENSPGSKFKDADLIGIPIRVTVGRGVKKSKVELKLRNDTQKREIDISDGFEELLKEIKKAKETYDPRNTK
jgi:prolyl-tRNA synthetase